MSARYQITFFVDVEGTDGTDEDAWAKLSAVTVDEVTAKWKTYQPDAIKAVSQAMHERISPR